MDPFFVATALKYYKRPEVQRAIVRHALNREISPRYGQGFGKRPDVLENPRDVLEFAKRKTTSFHCSEERWEDPMQIRTGMPRKEADEIRIGWDLVLDIDAKDWEISRLTAWVFAQALQEHGIKAISVKFSGNKGWHIGVPFEAFSRTVVDASGNDVHMASLFPEMPRAIATYLVDYIGNTANGLITIDDDVITFGGKVRGSLSRIAEKAGKTKREILEQFCTACQKPVDKAKEEHRLLCHSCGFRGKRRFSVEEKAGIEPQDLVCPKCKSVMEFFLASRGRGCTHASSQYQQRFKITEVIEFDTILLASRHLYRMPYSLHEKSGLVSAVVDVSDILTFKKEDAHPDVVSFDRMFLDPSLTAPGEAAGLVARSWEQHQLRSETKRTYTTDFEVAGEAIPEEFFPPCMQKILEGMRDGKKRAMFAIVNFLQVAGWPAEMIEQKMYEWNDRNPEQLREVAIKGHLKHHLPKKMKVLPPNCMSFYQELGVCNPDDLCRTVKNPVKYAMKKKDMGKKKS